MTVIVGVLCKDGVVIGTDSSATFGSGIPTIEQQCKKIEVINDKAILAGTGQVGLNQRFHNYVKNAFNGGVPQLKDEFEVTTSLCRAALVNFQQTFIGPKIPYGALLAFVHKTKFHLCEFGINDFQPELKTNSLWYVSMGSGQAIADPFLGFIRKLFWKDEPPNLEDGIFATIWTIQQAISLNPGGINGPIQISFIDSKLKTHSLSTEEIEQHGNNIDALEDYISNYKQVLMNSPSENIPAMAEISVATESVAENH